MEKNYSKNLNQINERMSNQIENRKQNKANGLEEYFQDELAGIREKSKGTNEMIENL